MLISVLTNGPEKAFTLAGQRLICQAFVPSQGVPGTPSSRRVLLPLFPHAFPVQVFLALQLSDIRTFCDSGRSESAPRLEVKSRQRQDIYLAQAGIRHPSGCIQEGSDLWSVAIEC